MIQQKTRLVYLSWLIQSITGEQRLNDWAAEIAKLEMDNRRITLENNMYDRSMFNLPE